MVPDKGTATPTLMQLEHFPWYTTVTYSGLQQQKDWVNWLFYSYFCREMPSNFSLLQSELSWHLSELGLSWMPASIWNLSRCAFRSRDFFLVWLIFSQLEIRMTGVTLPCVRYWDWQWDAKERIKGVALFLAVRASQGWPTQRHDGDFKMQPAVLTTSRLSLE